MDKQRSVIVEYLPIPNLTRVNLLKGSARFGEDDRFCDQFNFLRGGARRDIEVCNSVGKVFKFGDLHARLVDIKIVEGDGSIQSVEFEIISQKELEVMQAARVKIIPVFEA